MYSAYYFIALLVSSAGCARCRIAIGTCSPLVDWFLRRCCAARRLSSCPRSSHAAARSPCCRSASLLSFSAQRWRKRESRRAQLTTTWRVPVAANPSPSPSPSPRPSLVLDPAPTPTRRVPRPAKRPTLQPMLRLLRSRSQARSATSSRSPRQACQPRSSRWCRRASPSARQCDHSNLSPPATNPLTLTLTLA